MAKLSESYIFGGMQRDISVSKHPAGFLYSGLNVRLTTREGDTLMSITNEKGTSSSLTSITGDYLGHTLLNEFLVVFSVQGSNSYITRIDLSKSTPEKQVLYQGSLGFSKEHPIEAIASFENDNIQKVYWTDGVNQPRIINITAERLADGWDGTKSYWANLGYTDTSFDFVPDLMLEETVTVSKIQDSTGMFPPGVIQYAFTYYYKYGQETNIFYTSPLRFVSHPDRGGSPDDKIGNAFEIKVSNVDTRFDYLRIYSIQRTSLDATPICKRVTDIKIKGLPKDNKKRYYATFVDTGVNGNSIDPVELLYKGGESISGKTLEQKDNTLFIGNISIERPLLLKELRDNGYYDSIGNKIIKAGNYELTDETNIIDAAEVYEQGMNSYYYFNQLNCSNSANEYGVPCAGFKRGNFYRLGVQFQYKSGAWSNPFFLKDHQIPWNNKPSISVAPSSNFGRVELPRVECVLGKDITDFLKGKDYKKARAVVVYPEIQDRVTICQGVVNPTMFTNNGRLNDKNLLAQSSWFFRQKIGRTNYPINYSTIPPKSEDFLPYTENDANYNPNWRDPDTGESYQIRRVEVQGYFDEDDRFQNSWDIVTLNSPDIEFDGGIDHIYFDDVSQHVVGEADFKFTMSDIDIQTETPTISNYGTGFVHKSFKHSASFGIISGLFYDDFIVDDTTSDPTDAVLRDYDVMNSPCKWLVYPWHKNGSLNNDINRPSDKGTPTAVLKKKVISNLRYADTQLYDPPFPQNTYESLAYRPMLFNSRESEILKVRHNITYQNASGNDEKVDTEIYRGNVDTLLNPSKPGPIFFAFGDNDISKKGVETGFDSTNWYKLWEKDAAEGQAGVPRGIYKWNDADAWVSIGNDHIGDAFRDLSVSKGAVRMKYKSSPHLVYYSRLNYTRQGNTHFYLPIVEIRRSEQNPKRFGGDSLDALKENVWIPCGKPVLLGNEDDGSTKLNFNYGDTYFQRYDCLKTYAYTPEDINQIVEIGSFMLETYVNIDGRYDRNRGQMSNINMSPQNFNLINPVYNQRDNFFSYRILDEDFYTNTRFPNQITWSKEKQSGADVDLWTNITLASTYDMDGSKGQVVSLNTWMDKIFCFQMKGVSNILFNSRVQIPTSDNVPIEITNNYKVDGYRYISDGIGCTNPRLIREAPSGIFFIDSISNHLFQINEGIIDITQSHNMSSVFRNNIGTFSRVLYDDVNRDVYLVNDSKALCYSEVLGQFTSFMDYGSVSLIEGYNKRVFTMKDSSLYQMFAGDYCSFFGTPKPWGIIFISNGIGSNAVGMDKTFTNLEFRACVEGDGEYDESTGKFTPTLPFDTLRTWNEYQHGIAHLRHRNGYYAMMHHTPDKEATLKRKFRIWRCDIPRDNMAVTDAGTFTREFDKTFFPASRRPHPMDRMRNPWLYIKLQKEASESMKRTEIHDLVITYFT